MKKMAIIGSPGSGKSTLAVRLGEATGLPVIHLDNFYHTRTWNPANRKQEWKDFQRELVAQPEWIIDGNYKGTLDIRIPAADTVVFLDYPRALCVYRVLRRRLEQLLGRAALGGNPERLERDFLVFVWHYRDTERPKVLDMLRAKEDGVYILRSPREADAYVSSLQSACLL